VCVCAWSAEYQGAVVSYGTYPQQKTAHFTLRNANPTLADLAPGAGREGSIRAGLEALINGLVGQEWSREGGTIQRIERCLIDVGYLPDCVFDFCRTSVHAALLMPSRGLGIGATKAPLEEWAQRPGEKRGWHWIIAPAIGRPGRVARFDAHHFKSFAHARLAVALGDKGGLSLYGNRPDEHRLFSEHLVGEQPILVRANGRVVPEWRVRPGTSDVHYLDTLVGCCVGASILGCILPGAGDLPKPAPRPRMSLQAMKDAAEAKRRGY
jgi:hypothetical protein